VRARHAAPCVRVLTLHSLQTLACAAHGHFSRTQLAGEAVALELIPVTWPAIRSICALMACRSGPRLLPVRLWSGAHRAVEDAVRAQNIQARRKWQPRRAQARARRNCVNQSAARHMAQKPKPNLPRTRSLRFIMVEWTASSNTPGHHSFLAARGSAHGLVIIGYELRTRAQTSPPLHAGCHPAHDQNALVLTSGRRRLRGGPSHRRAPYAVRPVARGRDAEKSRRTSPSSCTANPSDRSVRRARARRPGFRKSSAWRGSVRLAHGKICL